MKKVRKVLLIAGGGTLGSYVTQELLEMGDAVEVICLEDKASENENLKYYKENVNREFLKEFLKNRFYDAIVDFLHYTDVEEYKKTYQLLITKTNHLVFLSSYRVYSSITPITEEIPRLADSIKDRKFLENEFYAVPKSKCEDFLKNECKNEHWTVVRPVISFSDKRLDCHLYNGLVVFEKAKSGEELIMPDLAKNLVAGLDWAGNSGKIIANLLFKPEAYGECYTISSAQNLTWKEIADIYSELIGLKVKWICEEEFLKILDGMEEYKKWNYFYDRAYDRTVDNSKVLKVTKLKKEDFKPIKEAIKFELEKIRRVKI